MIYHIFANKSNIGDWLSAKGIQTALSGYSIIELFCDQPFVDDTVTRLESIRPDDFVIIGGGGLFMDYFVPFWKAFRGVSNHVKYGLWGVGFCDLTQETSLPPIFLIEEIVRTSHFCYVRDELTRNHLSKLELAIPVVCPSLLCFPEITPTGRGLLHVDNFSTVGEMAFDQMDELGRKFANDTGRVFLRTNNRIRTGDEKQLRQCLDLYRQSDVVISSALHGCVIGIALGKKLIAVSGDRKIDSFMHAVGLQNWVCSNGDLSRLPMLLDNIEEQNSCDEQVKSFRHANEAIGRTIRTFLADIHVSEQ